MSTDLNFKKPIVQYLFLLSENPDYIKDIKATRSRFRDELTQIAKDKKAPSLIEQETGSEELKSAIRKIVDNSPLGVTPEWFLVNTLTVFLLIGMDKFYVLKELDIEAIKTLIGPPIIRYEVDNQETKIELAMTNYHTKSDVIKFLKKNWPSIEVERKKVVGKLKYQRPQPIKNLTKNWKIYSLHKSGKSYEDIRKSYRYYDKNRVVSIVKRLKHKITALYPSVGTPNL